ncbi:FAD-dependent oxidoreductase [Nocardia amikacinitolerans]|uniref:FAD-dependent oxidoreductase n=1 Tax=Nocardia amikacinitolerans TaxID=756689 RepID=UPI000832DEFD
MPFAASCVGFDAAPANAAVTVVGAGPTGIEVAAELAEQGRRVTLVCGAVLGRTCTLGSALGGQAAGHTRGDRARKRRREGDGGDA